MTVTSAASTSMNAALTKSNGRSAEQNKMLSNLSEPDLSRMSAQIDMQNRQETVAFISNMMKKANEIAMSVINNLR